MHKWSPGKKAERRAGREGAGVGKSRPEVESGVKGCFKRIPAGHVVGARGMRRSGAFEAWFGTGDRDLFLRCRGRRA